MLEQLSLCSELGSVGRKCLCFYKEKLWESCRKNFGNQMLKKYLKSFRIGVVIV